MAAAFSSSQKSYDVFLSFRGDDTRNNFTAHLLQELRTKGINTFFDEDKLEKGRVISPALITAIENSMFSIIVLSENYASSRWCLEEMVKILECNRSKEEDVRNHRGKFGEALAKHEENLEENGERVKIWRDALTEVANLSGWDSRNKNEPLLIKEIVMKLLKKLLNTSTSDTEENLVGIQSRIQKLRMLLCLQSDDVRMVGICAGNQDWFGQGSRIIVTTRDQRLLIQHKVDYYEVAEFNGDEAFEFLKHHSLKYELLENDLQELSREIIFYAKGLPLALRVLVERLLVQTKSTPNIEIQEVLRLSYDRLDDEEKNIFWILHSLITINFANKLEMHDLIQEMGKGIVRQECPKEPERRSRLWEHEDIFDVLKRNIEKIEGIFLNLSHLEDTLDFTIEAFAGMKNLDYFRDTFNNKVNCRVRFAHEFKFCSNDLRYLYWHGYSLKSLPKDFSPKHLVELSMPYSHIKNFGKESRLKSINLSHSKYLIQTPDFSGITNLERLVLEGCINLPKVHPSLGVLKKLNFLSLKNCKMLRRLPSSTCSLKSLETFILSGCSKFEEFPENFGNLEMLKELHADGIVVRVLPPSFFSMRNLEKLSFGGCKGPASASWLWPKRSSNSICFTVPSSSNLCSLKNLDLSYCNISDGANVSGLGFLVSLERLNLSGNNFATLPNMSGLSHLERLRLENCKRLQALSQLPSSIRSLNAKNCTSLGTTELLNLLLTTKVPTPLRPRELESLDSTFGVVIPGSRIPDWIRYQSSRNVIEADLPLNWSTNCLGFALALVFGGRFPVAYNDWFWARVFLDFGTCCRSIKTHIAFPMENLVFAEDHVVLTFAPGQPSLSPHQVIHIKATFAITSVPNHYEIKRWVISMFQVQK
ncbi:hypothetical protein AAG906_013760 [Vitis piasezkii]